MLTSLVYLQQGNVKKYKKLMKIVIIEFATRKCQKIQKPDENSYY